MVNLTARWIEAYESVTSVKGISGTETDILLLNNMSTPDGIASRTIAYCLGVIGIL